MLFHLPLRAALGAATMKNPNLWMDTSYILMFLLLPMASLGLCYLVVRQTMQGLNMETQTKKMDRSGRNLIDWVHKGKKSDKLEKHRQLTPLKDIGLGIVRLRMKSNSLSHPIIICFVLTLLSCGSTDYSAENFEYFKNLSDHNTTTAIQELRYFVHYNPENAEGNL